MAEINVDTEEMDPEEVQQRRLEHGIDVEEDDA